jgi:methionyl-tRNA formyltransferase
VGGDGYGCGVGQRLAVFSVVQWSWATVRDWAERAGHEIAILVTLSGPQGLRDTKLAGDRTVFMVVPAVAACEAALADLDVDLGVVFSFPPVPDRVASHPRHGMVNLHPSLLPRFRGPNGFRALYEGEPRLGATLHYLTPDLDAGPILAQASYPTPEDVQPASALATLQRAAREALEAGVPRALAGAPGEPQDSQQATEAPRFSEQEASLDLALPTQLFHRRASALILAGIQPWIVLDDERRPLRAVRRLDGLTAASPGTVHLSPRRAVVATNDGVLELELGELPFGG